MASSGLRFPQNPPRLATTLMPEIVLWVRISLERGLQFGAQIHLRARVFGAIDEIEALPWILGQVVELVRPVRMPQDELPLRRLNGSGVLVFVEDDLLPPTDLLP